jgi:hypothetical protein
MLILRIACRTLERTILFAINGAIVSAIIGAGVGVLMALLLEVSFSVIDADATAYTGQSVLDGILQTAQLGGLIGAFVGALGGAFTFGLVGALTAKDDLHQTFTGAAHGAAWLGLYGAVAGGITATTIVILLQGPSVDHRDAIIACYFLGSIFGALFGGLTGALGGGLDPTRNFSPRAMWRMVCDNYGERPL